MKMVKIKSKRLLLLLLLASMLLVLSSCKKPECSTNADCIPRTCTTSGCDSGKCVYATKLNCCGNRLNESIKDGKPGNQCTCPQDFGKCQGKAKVTIGSRMEDAAYVHYYCNANNQCVLGVDSKDVVPQNFLDSITEGFFKASSIVKYSKPFDAGKDLFELKISLDDTNKDLILPIKITNVKLLLSSGYSRSEQLIADKDTDAVLNGIADQAVISVPLNLNYKPQEAEESGTVRYTLDYTYKKQVLSARTVNGTNIYSNETVRATFNAPSKQVLFIRSG